LEDFGKSTGFYNRELATFTAISRPQAKAVDIDTKKPVGDIPHFDDMLHRYPNKATQPRDRATLVHGEYKSTI